MNSGNERMRGRLNGTCSNIRLMSARLRSDIIECDQELIIKLYSELIPREDVEEEVFLTNLARSSGLRTQVVRGLVEDAGRWGYVYEKITGPTYLEWIVEGPMSFDSVPDHFASLHREIHRHRQEGMPSLKDRLRSMIDAGVDTPPSIKERAHDELGSLPEGSSICHGDFHPENILMASDGPIILDWVHAAAGHFMADVARSYLLLEVWLPRKVKELGIPISNEKLEVFRRRYRDHYLQLCDEPSALLDRWLLPVAVARLCQGVPDERDQLMRIIEDLS